MRFIIPLPETAVTVAADIVEIVPASDYIVRVAGINLYCTSDVGDAEAENIGLHWIRGNTTGGSGGNSDITPTPQNPKGTVAAGLVTVDTFHTTQAAGGTEVICGQHGFSVPAPMDRPYISKEEPAAHSDDSRLVLRMGAAPADSITIGGSICIEVVPDDVRFESMD